MFDCPVRGVLRFSAEQDGREGYLIPPPAIIARLVGSTEAEVETLLAELRKHGVCSTYEDGTIYSRRMYREWLGRQRKVSAGRKGGKNKQGHTRPRRAPASVPRHGPDAPSASEGEAWKALPADAGWRTLFNLAIDHAGRFTERQTMALGAEYDRYLDAGLTEEQLLEAMRSAIAESAAKSRFNAGWLVAVFQETCQRTLKTGTLSESDDVDFAAWLRALPEEAQLVAKREATFRQGGDYREIQRGIMAECAGRTGAFAGLKCWEESDEQASDDARGEGNQDDHEARGGTASGDE